MLLVDLLYLYQKMMELVQYLEHDLVGKHTVGTGSSPQAVMTAL